MFPVKIIVRGSHHHELATQHKQDLTLHRISGQVLFKVSAMLFSYPCITTASIFKWFSKLSGNSIISRRFLISTNSLKLLPLVRWKINWSIKICEIITWLSNGGIYSTVRDFFMFSLHAFHIHCLHFWKCFTYKSKA